jgi:predicted nuclease with TOPRIM domain
MNAKVKDLRTELAALASFKHAAEGFRKDLAEQTEQIELLDEEKKDISDGLAKTDQELEEAAAIVDEMEEIQGDIDQCKNQLHQHQSIIKARRDLLDEDLTGRYNVRQLKELLRDFDDKMSTQMDEKDRLESEYREVQQRIERLRQEEMQLNGRMGKFAAEKEAHERHVRERQSKMESIQKTFSIDFHESTTQLGASFAGTMTPASQNFLGASQDGTATTALNDTEVAHFFQTLGRKEVELKANLKNKKERLRKQEDELQAVLTDYGGKVRALESGRSFLLHAV